MIVNWQGPEPERIYTHSSEATQRYATRVLEFLSAGFDITWFHETRPNLWQAIIKPHQEVADYFSLDREYFLIGNGFESDFHQRTFRQELPTDEAYRVDSRIRFVACEAPLLKASCAAWAQEHHEVIVPISLRHLDPQKAKASQLNELLANSLWRVDVFDDSEPIDHASEFFGRELAVQELSTRILRGQLAAVFGLRKVGKSSLLRRVRSILEAARNEIVCTSSVQCNATRIRSGRWHLVASDIIREWGASLKRRLEHASSTSAIRLDLPAMQLPPYVTGQNTASESKVADLFQKDVEKLSRTARNLAQRCDNSTIRFAAFFDEIDEVYPTNADAGHWREGYFQLWNMLQSTKRGSEDPRTITYIVCGVNPIGVEAGVLAGRANPLFEQSRLYLKPLPESESRQLLQGLGARIGLAFNPEAVAVAQTITGGHPWLLRRLGSFVHRADTSTDQKRIVTADKINEVFRRHRASFYQHVDWILSHLKAVASDEYRLLRDMATSGSGKYSSDWADKTFRDTFAQHLVEYGLLHEDAGAPVISIGLVREVLQGPTATSFIDQKTTIRNLADQIEASIRTRLSQDIPATRTLDEAIEFIATSIPKEATGRSLARNELITRGQQGGLRAILEALNWGDYLELLSAEASGIRWTGPEVTSAQRRTTLSDSFKVIHLARHSNDSELQARIQSEGFESLNSMLKKVLEALVE